MGLCVQAGNYRTYPVRKGEKLADVLDKRGITMDEFKTFNPDVNPKKVKGAAPARVCAPAPLSAALLLRVAWVPVSQAC
jgi:hypothetical protein